MLKLTVGIAAASLNPSPAFACAPFLASPRVLSAHHPEAAVVATAGASGADARSLAAWASLLGGCATGLGPRRRGSGHCPRNGPGNTDRRPPPSRHDPPPLPPGPWGCGRPLKCACCSTPGVSSKFCTWIAEARRLLIENPGHVLQRVDQITLAP